jgi:transcriptional antiterminator RfaH
VIKVTTDRSRDDGLQDGTVGHDSGNFGASDRNGPSSAYYPQVSKDPKFTGLDVQNWYLVRTKTGGERIAQQQLQHVVERTLLPLGKTQVRQKERTFQRIAPIFPCYLFAYFCLGRAARQIRYTPGVRDIVRFGEQAATVPDWVINELASRCAEGPVEFSKHEFSQGAPIKVVCGPFREFRAVFDGYLSGTDRVAVLLSIMNAERRIVMPTSMVMAAA